MVGGNFRLDAMQAAILRVKFKHLSAYRDARSAHAEIYNAQLGSKKGFALASGNTSGAKLILPCALEGNTHVWNQYTVRAPGKGRRDALKALFASRGIGSDIYYPLTLDMQECFKGRSKGGESCKIAHSLADEVLSIPVYPELSAEQQNTVIEALSAFAEC